jgi:hypothetical protein
MEKGRGVMAMKLGTIVRLLVVVVGTLGSAHAVGADPPASLAAPAKAPAGSKVAVKWTGPGYGLDTIAIVPAGSPRVRRPTQTQEGAMRKLILGCGIFVMALAFAPSQAGATSERVVKSAAVKAPQLPAPKGFCWPSMIPAC